MTSIPTPTTLLHCLKKLNSLLLTEQESWASSNGNKTTDKIFKYLVVIEQLITLAEEKENNNARAMLLVFQKNSVTKSDFTSCFRKDTRKHAETLYTEACTKILEMCRLA